MNSKNKKLLISVFIIIFLVVTLGLIIKIGIIDKNKVNSEAETETTATDIGAIIEESGNISVQATGESTYTDYDAKIDLNKMTSSGSGVSISSNTVKITSGGVYYLSGTLSDGKIEVEAKGEEVVLVLDGVDVTCKNTSPLNIIKAETVIINLVSGSENVFTDGSTYTEFTEDDEPDGTIFSKADLYINGSGSLKVNANYADGIVSKDTLSIENAKIEVTAKDDGIRGKDFVSIKNATIKVDSDGDSIKSTNDTDQTLGYVVIEDSDLTINSGDDAIHAETTIKINSGKIDIKKSYEGIEALYIEMTGGYVVVAGSVNGGNGALDYDKSFNISGGTLIAYGASGMWQNPSTTSSQYSICFGVSGNSGDKLTLKDSNGNEIASITATKAYGAILISSKDLKQGETYSLYINGTESASQELTSIVTSNITGGMNGGMQGEKMQQGGQNGGRMMYR